ARDGTASLTRIRLGGTTRPTRSPRTRASPIFPTPAIPIVSCPSIGPPPPRRPLACLAGSPLICKQDFEGLLEPWSRSCLERFRVLTRPSRSRVLDIV